MKQSGSSGRGFSTYTVFEDDVDVFSSITNNNNNNNNNDSNLLLGASLGAMAISWITYVNQFCVKDIDKE